MNTYKIIYLNKVITFLTSFALSFIAKEAFADKKSYLEYCTSSVMDEKYEKHGCWGCSIIKEILIALIGVIESISGPILELSFVILSMGSAIWFSLFFLKTLGSFATQDPAKTIDAFLTFAFKITMIYALLNAGISDIVEIIVNPLLSIGYDIGKVFTNAAGV